MTVRRERLVVVSLGTEGIAIERRLSLFHGSVFTDRVWSSGYGNDPTRVSLSRVPDKIRHGEGEKERGRVDRSSGAGIYPKIVVHFWRRAPPVIRHAALSYVGYDHRRHFSAYDANFCLDNRPFVRR